MATDSNDTAPSTAAADDPATLVKEEGECEPAAEAGILSHKKAMEKFREIFEETLAGDELLHGLPSYVTTEEINSEIALLHGQAMLVYVKRADDQIMPIVVLQSGTVMDLKHAIRRYFNLKQTREGILKKISWRYIWRTYWLYFGNQKLLEDNKLLKDYGIRNKDQVTFVKRLKIK